MHKACGRGCQVCSISFFAGKINKKLRKLPIRGVNERDAFAIAIERRVEARIVSFV